MNPIRILCVDDEPQVRKLLQRSLGHYGYKVTTAASGETALSLAAQITPDVVTLDVDLGNAPDGIAVCQSLREWSSAPVIILSERNDKRIKLAALNGGADDYVVKPFDVEELEARIRAIMRRSAIRDSQSPGAQIKVNGLVIDLEKRHVTLNDSEVHLTPREYHLLRFLAVNAGKVITNRMLLDEVWPSKPSAVPHSVNVYINRLRKKLGEETANAPQYIRTVPGAGYRFVELER